MEDETVISPENAVMDCEISPGEPKAVLHWYKEAKEIYKGKKYDMTYENNIAELVVKESEPNDSATYRCEAVNKIGRAETEGKLIVISKDYSYSDHLRCW